MGKTFKDNKYKDQEKQSFKNLKKQWKNERIKKQQQPFMNLHPRNSHNHSSNFDHGNDQGRDTSN